MMMGQDFFKKVFPETERDQILQDLVQSGEDLFSKVSESQILILKPFLLKKEVLSCKTTSPRFSSHLKKFPSSSVHNFALAGERYYFQGPIELSNDRYEITVPQDLYQLQRRQSFRVKIPKDLLGTIETRSIEDREIVAQGRLIDLSLGGCSFEIPNLPPPTRGSEVKFDIIFSKTLFFTAIGKVRRSQVHETQGQQGAVVGVEFSELSPAHEQKIFNLTLDLHRSSYGRLA